MLQAYPSFLAGTRVLKQAGERTMPDTDTEIIDRYHCLRAASTRHHSGALGCLTRQAILEQAKRLGLAYGRTLLAESEEEMTLLFDLAIYTAKPGRSRAIDRYARSVTLQPGSDEALTLDAMCQARFSLWRIERRHIGGVMVADLLRDGETWLLDQGLAHSAYPGMTVASRLCWPAEFAMTCGVVVPVDVELVEDALNDGAAWLSHADPQSLADDPRFAAAIYCNAIDTGIMENVVYQEPAAAD